MKHECVKAGDPFARGRCSDPDFHSTRGFIAGFVTGFFGFSAMMALFVSLGGCSRDAPDPPVSPILPVSEQFAIYTPGDVVVDSLWVTFYVPAAGTPCPGDNGDVWAPFSHAEILVGDSTGLSVQKWLDLSPAGAETLRVRIGIKNGPGRFDRFALHVVDVNGLTGCPSDTAVVQE